MVKKLLHRPLRLGLAGALAALVLLLLLYGVGRSHNFAQSERLSIGPNPASPGSAVMVSGFEYPANKAVEVYFQDRSNGVVHAVTNAGGFFNTSLLLPKKYVNGPAYVYVVSSNQTTKTQLNFARPSMRYGASNSLNGSGFIAHEPISLALHNGAEVAKMGTLVTDNQGHFTFAVRLPDMPFGSHATLTATDSMNKQVSVILPLNPMIQLYPSAGRAGTRVYVVGQGFARKEIVKIYFQGKYVTKARTSKNGNFAAAFIVPSYIGRFFRDSRTSVGGNFAVDYSVPSHQSKVVTRASVGTGENFTTRFDASTSAASSDLLATVVAIGTRSGATASAIFVVLPSVSLFPIAYVTPGELITALGSGFTPGGTVQILWLNPGSTSSSTGRSLGSTVASPIGTIATTFVVPGDAISRSVYEVVFIDVASGLSVTVPVFIH